MIPDARLHGARGLPMAGLAAALCLALAAAPAPAAADSGENKNVTHADIALAGLEPDVARVQSVVAELLERENVVVSTTRVDCIRPEEVIAAPAPSEWSPVGAWIDVGSTREALLYFRDASGQRFVLRKLALDNGLDEVAVEEIGHIAKSVVLALAAGDEPALTIVQARAILQPAQREVPKPVGRRTAHPLVAEVGVSLLGQLFSPEISLSPRMDLRLALLSDHDWGPRPPIGGWLSIGYGQTPQYQSPTVDLDLATVAARIGAVWEPSRSSRVVTRIGIGGGFDLVDFTPHPSSSGVAPAAGGRFLTPVGTVVADLNLEVLGPLAFGAGAEVDFYAADIHYDLQQTDGRVRLLVPYRVRPGLMLTVSAIF
jgi:hypothetical protein